MRNIMYLSLHDIKREIKFFFQRLIKGYDDGAVWNLNSHILKNTYKPLKEFVRRYEEEGMSLPSDFTSDPNAWLFILKDIEYAFDSWYKDENDDSYEPWKWDKETQKAHYERINRGFEMFGKYIQDLWD